MYSFIVRHCRDSGMLVIVMTFLFMIGCSETIKIEQNPTIERQPTDEELENFPAVTKELWPQVQNGSLLGRKADEIGAALKQATMVHTLTNGVTIYYFATNNRNKLDEGGLCLFIEVAKNGVIFHCGLGMNLS